MFGLCGCYNTWFGVLLSFGGFVCAILVSVVDVACQSVRSINFRFLKNCIACIFGFVKVEFARFFREPHLLMGLQFVHFEIVASMSVVGTTPY